MRVCLLIAGVVCLSAAYSAEDAKTYESKAGKYKVVFPGDPMATSKKVDDNELNSASLAVNGGGFFVIYSDLPAEKLKDSKPKDILASGEKGLVDSVKAEIKSSKDIEFGKQKYPARQLEGEATLPEESVKVNLKMTIILADNRLYQVFVFGPKDLLKGKEAEKFFDSFEITK